MGGAVATGLMLAAATASPGGTAEAAVAAIYAPYSGPVTATAAWEYPIFSKQTAALIARWRMVTPQDEPDALSDGDWLCLCQEFDNKAFKAAVLSQREARGGTQVAVRLDLGFGARRDVQLELKREGEVWRLDDLYGAPDFPNGLKQKLQETILEESIP